MSQQELAEEARLQAEEAQRQKERALKLAEEQRFNAFLSDIAAADGAVRKDEFEFARELLLRHRPEPTQRDLRGFEWRYLWDASRDRSSASTTYDPLNAEYVRTTVSPDDTLLAVALDNVAVRIYNLPDLTLRTEISLFERSSGGTTRMRFSADGSRLYVMPAKDPVIVKRKDRISTSYVRELRVYDTTTWKSMARFDNVGSPLLLLPTGEPAFKSYPDTHSADRRAESGRLMKLVEAGTGQFEKHPTLQNLPLDVVGLAPRNGTEYIALLSREQGLPSTNLYKQIWQIWDISAPDDAKFVSECPPGISISLYPDGTGYAYQRFLENYNFRIEFQPLSDTPPASLDSEATDEDRRLFGGDFSKMNLETIFLTEDSQFVVGAGLRSIHVWEAQTGRYRGTIDGHPGLISRFVLTGNQVICVYQRHGLIKAWDLNLATKLNPNLQKIPQVREDFTSFRDENDIVANLTHTLHPQLLERFKNGSLPWSLPEPLGYTEFDSYITTQHISPDGRYLGIITIEWTPNEQSIFPQPERIVRYYDLWSEGQRVVEWELAPLFQDKHANEIQLRGFPKFLDESRLIVEQPDGFELWDLHKKTRSSLAIPYDIVVTSPDGNDGFLPHVTLHNEQLLIPSWNALGGTSFSLWDMDNQRVAKSLFEDSAVRNHYSLSPPGSRIALSGKAPNLLILDLENGELVTELKLDYAASETKAWYSPDGRNILTYSKTPRTRQDGNRSKPTLWLAESSRELIEIQGLLSGSNEIMQLKFSADGNNIYLWPRYGTSLYTLTVPTLEQIDNEIEQELALSH